MAPENITAVETGRDLVISAPHGDYVIAPLPAKHGGALMGQFVGVTFGTLVLPVEEQDDMFKAALGEEMMERLQNTLRLPEVTPIAMIAMYWQTVGMEGVNAYLGGGPGKAMEVLLSQMGLLQPKTSSSLAAAVTTPSPAATSGTSTRSGGETA